MLPKPKTRSTEEDAPGARGRSAPSVPFLKVEDLTAEGKRAKILGVQSQRTKYNDLVVKLAIGGRSFFFGLRLSNPNFETLYEAFGADENKWVGQEFLIGLEWNDFYEKNFVRVLEAPAKKSKGEK
jgi:hypothetical protein